MPLRFSDFLGIVGFTALPLLGGLGFGATPSNDVNAPEEGSADESAGTTFALSEDTRTVVQPILDERPDLVQVVESGPAGTQIAVQVLREMGETRSALGATRERTRMLAERLGENPDLLRPRRVPRPASPTSVVEGGPVESFDTGMSYNVDIPAATAGENAIGPRL